MIWVVLLIGVIIGIVVWQTNKKKESDKAVIEVHKEEEPKVSTSSDGIRIHTGLKTADTVEKPRAAAVKPAVDVEMILVWKATDIPVQLCRCCGAENPQEMKTCEVCLNALSRV